MRLWPAVAAAALLTLAVEASLREIPSRAARRPTSPPNAADRAASREQAQERVARAEAAFGTDSPETARALADEAFVLWGLEEFRTGLPIAERALALRRTAPRETAELAGSLYQVADFRRATGDYAGALEAYRGAIAVWTRLDGPDHAENGSAWHYIGILHGVTGDPEGARAALERALAIRERALGSADPLVANTLHALAGLEARVGGRDAEPLYLRAQRIWEDTLGPRDPMVARSLLARAALRMAAGDSAGAQPLLERALAIRIETFGPRYYLVAQARRVQADRLARDGHLSRALDESEAALDLLRADLGPVHPEVASALADRARLLWAAGRRADALVAALSAERMAREQFLRSSRALDDSLALRYAASRTSGLDVLLTALADGVAGAKEGALAADFEPSAAAREIVDAVIRSRGMVLDAPAGDARGPEPIASAVPEGGDPGLAEIRRATPPGSALVAFARYRRVEAWAHPGRPSYLAVVLRPGSPASIIPLGSAVAIETAVAAWRAEVRRGPSASEDADRGAWIAGERLRRAIWDPVAPALAGAGQVFIVPDGALDLVPFAALPDRAGRFLVETGPALHYLSAERDLVTARRHPPSGWGMLAVGGPDFDAPDPAPPSTSSSRSAARPLCPDFGALRFEPLAGALEEAREVASPAEAAAVLGGDEATAAAFEAGARGRRILHLATHAWVLPERCAEAPSRGELPDLAVAPTGRVLLRSGLAFAGANRHDHGILTAEQIAALDLSGVEWVVLSACDTGLGEIHAGEGVVGLRHAFERAGAATVIMSLWGADDGAARSFMRALYAARRGGASTSEAMRRAALDLLDFQRSRGRTTHPYYWGGFVAAGDWR